MLFYDVAVHFLCVVGSPGLIGLVVVPGIVQEGGSGVNDQFPVFYIVFQRVDHPFQLPAGLLRA